MNRRFILTSLVIVGLSVALFLVGKNEGWWSFGKTNDTANEETETDTDPEPGEGPTPPPPVTTTSTTTTTTKPKPTTKPSKKVAYNKNKPMPSASFSAGNEAYTIANLLANWTDLSGQDVKAFNKILGYTENELRAVHNAWLDKYPNGIVLTGIKPTMREQIRAEAVWNNRTDAVNKKAECLKRLDNLNIP